MTFTLERVVLWGRSFDEYRRMFALTDADLERSILGCADGPSSFNVELTALGGSVVSFDPIFEFSADEIRERINGTSAEIIAQAWRNLDTFVWSDSFPNPDALGRHRISTMNRFLADYEAARHTGRYVVAEFPKLPFLDRTFEIAICSHFLFLYSQQLSEQFHVDSIRELMRVANEARIFPLTELAARPSRHREPVANALRAEGFEVGIETVDYEVQRGGNQLMRITR